MSGALDHTYNPVLDLAGGSIRREPEGTPAIWDNISENKEAVSLLSEASEPFA